MKAIAHLLPFDTMSIQIPRKEGILHHYSMYILIQLVELK